MSRKVAATIFALALAAMPSVSPVTAATAQVTILARHLWQTTGIKVHAGDVIAITASGSWTWGGDSNVGPDGDPIDNYNAFDLFQPFDFFSQARVIAYIGKSPVQKHWGDGGFFPQQSGYFSIGSGQTFIAPYDGLLWVGMNDAAVTESRDDNKGSMIVNVATGALADRTAPTITINAPASVYLQHQNVLADYNCTDPDNAVATCVGQVAAGATADTSVVGPHAFTVVSTDSNGNTSSSTTGYVVTDTNSAAVTPTGGNFEQTYLSTRSPYHQFFLTNPQASAISISNIAVQGDFEIAGTNCGTTLGARKACRISVDFRPTLTGTGRGELDVTASVGVVPVPLWGVGTLVKAAPAALAFADQAVSTTSAPMILTVTNNQGQAFKIVQAVATGDFALDPSGSCKTTGGMLKVGKSCTIAVTFAPTATGARTGSLTVHGSTAISPVTVSLTGNGT
jgi:hypothetical protein